MWAKFELIQAFLHVLVTCNNEDGLIKNEGAGVVKLFSHYKPMEIFQTLKAANSAVLAPIWPNFELVLDSSPARINKIRRRNYNRIKNESARVVTRFPPL